MNPQISERTGSLAPADLSREPMHFIVTVRKRCADSLPASAPCGPHSGLMGRIGLMTARLTRLRLSTWCRRPRWLCTLRLAAPSPIPCRRARSSNPQTALSYSKRIWAASLRIRIKSPMALNSRLPKAVCLLQSLQSRLSSTWSQSTSCPPPHTKNRLSSYANQHLVLLGTFCPLETSINDC